MHFCAFRFHNIFIKICTLFTKIYLHTELIRMLIPPNIHPLYLYPNRLKTITKSVSVRLNDGSSCLFIQRSTKLTKAMKS